MASRLDRLLLLLDTGSSQSTRRAAAEQLGEVQKLHPHELQNLLFKVLVYLRSDSWDTRIAAGYAIEAIVKQVPLWEPEKLQGKSNDSATGTQAEARLEGRMGFSSFNITRVLQQGKALLGSAGDEYDLEPDSELINLSQSERAARQRKILQKRLGLEGPTGLGFDKDLFEDDDLIPEAETQPPKSKGEQQTSAAEFVSMELGDGQGLSAREKNRKRRMAKKAAKNRMKEAHSTSSSFGSQENIGESDGNPAKKPRTSNVLVPQGGSSDRILVDAVADVTATFEEAVEWPFESFCDELCYDLFNPKWTIRHGASTGLREILKIHAHGAGKAVETPMEQMEICNLQCLEDLALRLLCVFALDRFGDYLSDEVVAPVREMCAQTLGVVMKHMAKLQVQAVLNVLLTLQAQEQWQVRYGGLLGAKYLLAVRQDMTEETLPLLLNSVKQGLDDPVDDVRAVAAMSLLPVTDKLIALMPQELPSLLSLLWDTLAELDELTASTNGVMLLLSSLYSSPNVLELTASHTSGPYSLSHLVPRLWPFLSHTIVSVRQATIRTLSSLLSCSSREKIDASGIWVSEILHEMLRHVYQRLVLESREDLKETVLEVWIKLIHCSDIQELDKSVSVSLGMWLSLAIYPANMAINSSLLTPSKHSSVLQDRAMSKSQSLLSLGDAELKLGGISGTEDSEAILTRLLCARALGELASRISKMESSSAQQQFVEFLSSMLSTNTNSATQRLVTALIVTEWATNQKPCLVPDELHKLLTACLDQSPVYTEVATLFGKLQTDCQNLLTAFLDKGVNLLPQFPPGDFSVESATSLVTSVYHSAIQALNPGDMQAVQQNKIRLSVTVNKLRTVLQRHHIRVQAALATAVVAHGLLPAKLNPVIRPLMESIKREENEMMQKRSARHLAQLLGLCRNRTPCPNDKIVKNLCTLLCANPDVTPRVADPVPIAIIPASPAGTPTTPLTPDREVMGLNVNRCRSPDPFPGKTCRGSSFDSEQTIQCGKFAGIVTLVKRRQAALIAAASHGRRGSGMVAKKQQQQQQQQRLSFPEITIQQIASEDDLAQRLLVAECRGAKASLLEISRFFADQLPVAQPRLWNIAVLTVQASVNTSTVKKEDDSQAQDLAHSLQVLEVIASAIDKSLQPQVLDLMPQLCAFLRHQYCAIRHMAARCIAAMTSLSVVRAMEAVIAIALPLLNDSDCVVNRQGAMETIAILVDELGMEVLPYAVLLVVPLLGRMGDQEEDVRLLATQSFASLVKLMPLEVGVPDPPGMAASLSKQRLVERRFLEQLLDPKMLDNYAMSVPIKTDLRKYQQDGVNWLGFLNKYKLHGILCDDMGLGKTLQTICIIAGDHDKLKKGEEVKSTDQPSVSSLVVCPPTLTGHWCYEVEKFCSPEHLSTLHYTGGPAERQRLWKMLPEHNLVVASYDIVRNDIEYFRGVNWNYVVLDEGHVIRNGKTKLSKAIKSLKADHRLILTGTPIQNNVLELWSLFDFLMPGFLGTEKEFAARYSRPILQSRDAKSSSKEQEAGVLAMEALHRQVLPFMLRRLKEDVLQDLPPKIIQDYYCELSSLQVWLYEDFAKSKAKKAVEKMAAQSDGEAEDATVAVQSSTHIFQALQYLRKLCNHPLLVVNEKHPRYEAVKERLADQKSSLRDMRHAGKLIALKQLLLDCGIGAVSDVNTSGDPVTSNPVVGQHRALIFCQLKSMLDVIENEMLKVELPSVSYLRLDGSIPPGSRYEIVRRFNSDPSIDVFLLTTHVGGLGLNLTGADTVIFVEHDWNPMRDLQAMDRAHRIGQKKVVNVYRLITRGTLEEKIMGLQKFKLSIANTVVTQDNSSLHSMGTSELLDLFDVGAQDDKKEKKDTGGGKQTVKNILENVESLWDEKQYETEYDLGLFMESLK